MISFRKFAALTRIEHTLFGLPQIIISALLPFFDPHFLETLSPRSWITWACVIPAFALARISGMAFNQYLDRDIDALNPRTQFRPIPSGKIKEKTALKIACISLGFFLLTTFCIHPLCFGISCMAAALIVLYSFMKRIHYFCHFVLGMIHFLGPIAAFVAIKNTIELPIIFLGLSALLLNSSNDILYALQDFTIDRKYKLHSIPSHFGIEKSIRIVIYLQAFCVLSLLLFGILSKFCWIYYLAPCFAIYYFVNFHKNWATNPGYFFKAQVGISMSTALFTFMACLWRVLF